MPLIPTPSKAHFYYSLICPFTHSAKSITSPDASPIPPLSLLSPLINLTLNSPNSSNGNTSFSGILAMDKFVLTASIV